MPGEKLSERKLQELYKCSRTPIREALKMLSSDGWIHTVAKKGTFISEFGPKQIKDLYRVRTAIESIGVQSAASRLKGEDINQLKSYYQLMSDALHQKDSQTFLKVDIRMHLFIAEKSGNHFLWRIIKNLTDNIQRLGSTALSLPHRCNESMSEWLLIIKALENKDSIHASNLMIKHILNTAEAALNSLEKESI